MSENFSFGCRNSVEINEMVSALVSHLVEAPACKKKEKSFCAVFDFLTLAAPIGGRAEIERVGKRRVVGRIIQSHFPTQFSQYEWDSSINQI